MTPRGLNAERMVKDVCREHEISEATYYTVEVEVWRNGSR
jgi:hypothetical protein